jgi:hypothetical protein
LRGNRERDFFPSWGHIVFQTKSGTEPTNGKQQVLLTPQGHILFQSKLGTKPTIGKWQMLLATMSMMILLPLTGSEIVHVPHIITELCKLRISLFSQVHVSSTQRCKILRTTQTSKTKDKKRDSKTKRRQVCSLCMMSIVDAIRFFLKWVVAVVLPLRQ